MARLPDNLELAKLLSAGMSDSEIAAAFGVTRQAVTKRFKEQGVHRGGPSTLFNKALPWDFAHLPVAERHRLFKQAGFAGLQAFYKHKTGSPLTDKGNEVLRAFLAHIGAGEVLAYEEEAGFIYCARTVEDGDLVIRWPEGKGVASPTAQQRQIFAKPATN
ncbi:helix-turn-helix domain-containing protein [Streptomyces sp. NPDC051546]|uniref:helix-turn-helix domain-containing protein n=1 Tax=Streptomyces sp. NPDC051546 TaxID=3365655 RepID=UPI0037B4AC29